MRLRIATFAFALLASIARAQVPRAEHSSSCWLDLGWVLYDLGDRNRDGARDVAVAFPGCSAEEYDSQVVVYAGGLDRNRLGTLWLCVDRTAVIARQADGAGEALVVVRDETGGFIVAIGAPGPGQDGRLGGTVQTFTGLESMASRLRWQGRAPGEDLGASLARVPDLDGDGIGDLAIGAPGARPARVEIVSTASGKKLCEWVAPDGGGRFGAALASVGEFVGSDAIFRVAVGAPESVSGHGAVFLYSRGDAQVPPVLHAGDGERGFGARLVADDLDRNLRVELLVGSQGSGEARATVTCFRAGAWQRVWTATLSSSASRNGLQISTCADLNGDAVRDVLATLSPGDRTARPELVVLSGTDGSELHAIRGMDPALVESAGGRARRYFADAVGLVLGSRLGAAEAGDQDGDGIGDVWFAMSSDAEGPPMSATLALLSGKDLRGGGGGEWNPVSIPIASRDPVESEPEHVSIAELPQHFAVVEKDEMSPEDREWTCVDSAWGKRIAVLGDLDGDGKEDLWVSGVASRSKEYRACGIRGADGARIGQVHDGDLGTAARIGDVDGDGHDEIVVGASERTHRFCEMIGRAFVVSTKSWEPLYELENPDRAFEFAATVTALSDRDGDGVREVAVATPAIDGWTSASAPRACQVTVMACGEKSGTILHVIEGDATAKDGFGRALAFGGDWNGDGIADLAIGAPSSSAVAVRGGAVHVHSGADWSRLASFAGSVAGEGFGRELAWSRDLDGDGRSEIIVAAPFSGPDSRGRVVVISSKSGRSMLELRGPRPQAAFGASLALGDFDRDGSDELAIGAPGCWHEGELAGGSVSIHSLPGGRERLRIHGAPPPAGGFMEDVEWTVRAAPYGFYEPTLPFFGRALASVSDLDGGGDPDLVIGAPAYRGPDHAGTVYALTGRVLAEKFAPDTSARDR
jgi:hypothetical protein